jgi:hypothetical protein
VAAMTEAPEAREIVRRAVAIVQERLPKGWSTDPVYEGAGRGGPGADAVVEITGPDNAKVLLVLECKRSLVRRDLPALLQQLADYSAAVPGATLPVVVSQYLSSSVRGWLDKNDVSYIDATGNLRLVSREPAVYLRDRGADRDPWRGPGRPRGSLRGAPAARVVRALADFRSPLPVTTLVSRSGASTGATYRVLDFLEEEALIARGARGIVEEVRWRELLERWSQDYGFQESNEVKAFLQPRGLPALRTALEERSDQFSYAVTGSMAAELWAPYASVRLAMMYVKDVTVAADLLGLREVDSGANVLLATPPKGAEVVFDRSSTIEGITYAAASQVAVDLLTGPGRNPAEGQALLDWMETNELAWRN